MSFIRKNVLVVLQAVVHFHPNYTISYPIQYADSIKICWLSPKELAMGSRQKCSSSSSHPCFFEARYVSQRRSSRSELECIGFSHVCVSTCILPISGSCHEWSISLHSCILEEFFWRDNRRSDTKKDTCSI